MSLLSSRNPWYLFSNIASVSSKSFRSQKFFFRMIPGSEDVSQDALRPPRHDEKGNVGNERTTYQPGQMFLIG